MNPLLLLIPIGIGLFIWNRNKTTTQSVLAGTQPVQVTAAAYDSTSGTWTITANVTQPNGDIGTMNLSIPGPPTEQPTITQVEAAIGQAQTQTTQNYTEL